MHHRRSVFAATTKTSMGKAGLDEHAVQGYGLESAADQQRYMQCQHDRKVSLAVFHAAAAQQLSRMALGHLQFRQPLER